MRKIRNTLIAAVMLLATAAAFAFPGGQREEQAAPNSNAVVVYTLCHIPMSIVVIDLEIGEGYVINRNPQGDLRQESLYMAETAGGLVHDLSANLVFVPLEELLPGGTGQCL